VGVALGLLAGFLDAAQNAVLLLPRKSGKNETPFPSW